MTTNLATVTNLSHVTAPAFASNAWYEAIRAGEISKQHAMLELYRAIPTYSSRYKERAGIEQSICNAAFAHECRRQASLDLRPKPKGWGTEIPHPRYNTPEYYEAVRYGWLSDEEQEAIRLAWQTRSKRAKEAQGRRVTPSRHQNPEPRDSRQYASAMATRAARDPRLTPKSLALLQQIVALCGNRTWFDTTKAQLAGAIGRSARSIQRYLSELRKFGYIEAATTRHANRMHAGVQIRITELVRPFFKEDSQLAEWLLNGGNLGKTRLSHLITTIEKSSLFTGQIQALKLEIPKFAPD